MTPAERDVADEDYEGRKDDTAAQSGRLLGGQADYETRLRASGVDSPGNDREYRASPVRVRDRRIRPRPP
jgi:hypothetical protein